MKPSTASPSTKRTEAGAGEEARSAARWGLPDRAVFVRALRALAPRSLLPGIDLPPRRGLLVLGTFALVGLCAGLAVFGARPRPEPAGFDLRAEDSSSKLNSTSAGAPATLVEAAPPTELDNRSHDAQEEASRPQPVPAPVAQAPSPEPAPPSLTPAAPAVVLPQLPPTTPAAPVLPVAVQEAFSANCYVTREPHRGDSPMMRTWKLLGLNTLLAAALSTPVLAGQLDGPAAAQPEERDKSAVLEKLKGLEKKLDDMEAGLKKSIDNLETNALLKTNRLQRDMEDLKGQIAQLRQDVDAMRTREFPTLRKDMEDGLRNRQSNYPSTAASPATGRVQLRNTFPEMMTIIVNGVSQRVLPNQTVTVPVPAGTFTYWILGVQAQPQTRTLAANETYDIHVFPR
jgi:hypothetical protein